MKKKTSSLIIPICLILMTAGIIESSGYQMVLLAIAAFLAIVLAYDSLSSKSDNTGS